MVLKHAIPSDRQNVIVLQTGMTEEIQMGMQVREAVEKASSERITNVEADLSTGTKHEGKLLATQGSFAQRGSYRSVARQI